MRKKKYIFTALAVFVCIGVCAVSIKAINMDKSAAETYGAIAQIEKNRMADKAELKKTEPEILEDENNYQITSKDLGYLTSEYEIIGHDREEAEALALKTLTEKKAMFIEAVRNGYLADEQYVFDLIEYSKEKVPASSNYDDILAYYEGLGMTNDEYWDAQYDNLFVYETIALYKNALKETFDAQNTETAAKNSESDLAWQDYYSEIVKKAVEDVNIEIVG